MPTRGLYSTLISCDWLSGYLRCAADIRLAFEGDVKKDANSLRDLHDWLDVCRIHLCILDYMLSSINGLRIYTTWTLARIPSV